MESHRCDFTLITLVEKSDYSSLKKASKEVKEIKKKMKKHKISIEWIVLIEGKKIEKIKHSDKVITNIYPESRATSINRCLKESKGIWISLFSIYQKINDSMENNLIYIKKTINKTNIGWIANIPSHNIQKSHGKPYYPIKEKHLLENIYKHNIDIQSSVDIIIKKDIIQDKYLNGWSNIPYYEDMSTLIFVSEVYKGILTNHQFYSMKKESNQKMKELNEPFSIYKIQEFINRINNKTIRNNIAQRCA